MLLTIIDCIGFKKDHVAAFLGDERVELAKVSDGDIPAAVKALKARHFNEGMEYMELKCSLSHREFVSVSDFPVSLKAYFR